MTTTPPLEIDHMIITIYAPDSTIKGGPTDLEWRFLLSLSGLDTEKLAYMFNGLFKAIDTQYNWPEGTTFRAILFIAAHDPVSELTSLPLPS